MTNAVAYHDTLAAGWDDRYRTGSFARRSRFFSDQILPLVPLRGKWLDVGCGTGYFSRMLTQSGVSVVGIDASVAMIEEARIRAARQPGAGTARFEVVRTVEKIPFESAEFDACIVLSVIEYLNDPDACLDEVSRILKSGGYFIFSIPHNRSVIRGVERCMRITSILRRSSLEYLQSSMNSMTFKSVNSALNRRGMNVKKMLGFDAFLPARLHCIFPPSLIYAVAQKK